MKDKKWDIDESFDRMRKQMDRMYKSFFEIPEERGLLEYGKDLIKSDYKTPISDIYETNKEIKVKVEIPGVEKKDINLDITNNILTISAEKKKEKEEKDKKGYHRYERSYIGFYRQFSLPENIEDKKVDATYKDGLLEITIPKKETKKISTNKINIK